MKTAGRTPEEIEGDRAAVDACLGRFTEESGAVPPELYRRLHADLQALRSLLEAECELALRLTSVQESYAVDILKVAGTHEVGAGSLSHDSTARLLLDLIKAAKDERLSFRALLFSSLAICFSVPLAALNLKPTADAVFRAPISHLPLATPAELFAAAWTMGAVLMGVALFRLIPNVRLVRGEVESDLQLMEVGELIGEADGQAAIDRLSQMLRSEQRRTRNMNGSRSWFAAAITCFLICAAVVLFSAVVS